jgi:hypothetical protein
MKKMAKNKPEEKWHEFQDITGLLDDSGSKSETPGKF